MRRWAQRVGGFIAAVILLAGGAAGLAIWLTLPPAAGSARIAGLSAPVSITFDADGIPRITAATERDGAAALGYVHARDRLFQMDMMRRAASGRLSELLGPAPLGVDRMMRTLGVARAAEADYAALPEDTQAMLRAYTNGVNAWIAERGRLAALESLVFGAPEPWRASDCLLWAKTMGLYLSGNWRTELTRMGLAEKIPQLLIDELWRGASLPTATRNPVMAEVSQPLPTFPDSWTHPASASNEWAVDGHHSATGAPVLAGDPHLGFGFPSIWYLARIDTPQATLTGATAPGTPFLIIGHNGRIAWTFTTTGADVQDVFIEPTTAKLTTRDERIKIRGQPDEILPVRESRHGPVISDLLGVHDKILTVAMANLAPGDTAATGLLALNRAATVAQAGAAAPVITSPIQNLLVADKNGIGQFVIGRIPIRKTGDGSAPAPGDGSHDWIGWASGQDLPHSVNPASGRLVNANERIAPPAFPIFLGRDWFGDWRARRIHTMLDGLPHATVVDFARMQTDIHSAFAAAILPLLPTSKLDGWDGTMTIAATQPLLFNRWVRAFQRLVLLRAGIAPEQAGPMSDFVAFVLSPAGAHWCGGDCGPLLREALDAANTKTNWAETNWGDTHQAIFAHPILRSIPWIGDWLTFAIPSPGDDTTVNRGGTDANLRSVHGASFRGVYDLADLDRSLFMMAPGQSGHPLRRHARDLLRRWRDGATLTLTRQATSVAETIELTP